MKTSMLIAALLIGASAAEAAIVDDDFNRAPVDYTSDTSQIGPHWQQNWSANEWSISTGGSLYPIIYQTEAVLYNDELQTTSGGGHSFTLNLIYAGRHNTTVWGGVAWNYQNPTNFYCLRYKNTTDNYQLLARVDGNWQVMGSGHAAAAFADSATYQLSISSSAAYSFDYSIKKVSDNSVMASGNVVDGNSNFTGGYAGVYHSNAGSANMVADNFSLETVFVPPTIELRGITNP